MITLMTPDTPEAPDIRSAVPDLCSVPLGEFSSLAARHAPAGPAAHRPGPGADGPPGR